MLTKDWGFAPRYLTIFLTQIIQVCVVPPARSAVGRDPPGDVRMTMVDPRIVPKGVTRPSVIDAYPPEAQPHSRLPTP